MDWDLNKLKAKGLEYVDAGKQIATDLAQKGKLQVKLLDAQNRKAKAERDLGQLVYSLHKNTEENNELVKQYIDSVAAIEQEIEALQAEAEKAAEEAPATVEGQAAEVAEPVAEPQPEAPAPACPQCGAQVTEDALFCPKCGQQL